MRVVIFTDLITSSRIPKDIKTHIVSIPMRHLSRTIIIEAINSLIITKEDLAELDT